jgi:hypothetical protein
MNDIFRGRLVVVAPLLVWITGCGEATAPPAPPSGTATTQANATQTPPPQESEPFVPTLEIEADDFVPEDGFTPLGVEDFVPFEGAGDTWQQIDGVIVCSGSPKGYTHSVQPYGNFTWRAEYRFAPVADDTKRPLANTGFMLHIQEPHKVWPNSLEVQGRWDEMASIKANGGAAMLTIDDDSAARESARKPVGEWNAVEIVSRNGAITATLNGQLVCISQPGELTEGQIGLQSELFEVHFRRLRIRVDE